VSSRQLLLIQPHNHGTAPAIAFSLTYIHAIDSEAVEDFFPSDHHLADDEAFTARMELAFAQAEQHAERVLLLGVAPDSPEEAYWNRVAKAFGKPGSSRLACLV
jgi:mannose-1-phosphate guanylyltransferase